MHTSARVMFCRFRFPPPGGVVEAAPPSDSVTSLTVDMFIAPSGHIKIECVGDQVNSVELATETVCLLLDTLFAPAFDSGLQIKVNNVIIFTANINNIII